MKTATKETVDIARTHRITESEVGREVRCPVTKAKVRVTYDTPALEYKGRVYYFCCDECPVKFRMNPEKYASKGKR